MNDDDTMMLPGFRFHPTDEELVDFYLRRKIQQKSLPIELIKQVDIYKYDPWDLPRVASTGEKEWYFYCPRDRKYRNSPRPNRVTRAGFWKATGTDRPIYSSSSQGKCIGLKKSLVFYRGRAAKGIKTDWMMHEFRLPPDSSSCPPSPARSKNDNNNKTLSPHDSWAICRIFKKTNSMAQKALSHTWMAHQFNNNLSSENMSCTTEIYEQVSTGSNNNFFGNSDNHVGLFNKASLQMPTVVSDGGGDVVAAAAEHFMFSALESSSGHACAYIGFEGPINNSNTMFNNGGVSLVSSSLHDHDHGHVELQASSNIIAEAIGFPFSLPPPVSNDAWIKPALLWESSPPCPSHLSTNRSST